MKYKLVCFDLDGVLIDSKEIHFESLNEALPEQYRITWDEHLRDYEGLSTKAKLDILSEKKGFPKDLHDQVWVMKQKITISKLHRRDWSDLFKYLHDRNLKIAICSNAIRKTVEAVVDISLVDLVICGDEVKRPKPYPEIYWKAMSHFGVLPGETLILEDSPRGKQAALNAGARLVEINDTSDVTINLFVSLLS